MASATILSLNSVLKQLYPQKTIREICYENHPLLGLIPKNTMFGGKNLVLANRYGTQQGRSAQFSDAQAAKSPNLYAGFTLTRVSDYSLGSIDGESIRAARGDKNALVEGLDAEIRGSLYAITRSLSWSLYGNGGGAIGRTNTAAFGVNTIQLTEPADVVHFEVGQVITASATDGTTGTIKPGSVTLTAIDRDAGTLTTGPGFWNAGIPTIAQNDYLFVKGDFGRKVRGLPAWIPATAPVAGDSFFGVDRSVDPSRLGGLRLNGGGAPIEEVLQAAMSKVYLNGATISHIFMNPIDMNLLTTALGSKTVYVKDVSKDEPSIGYRGVHIVGEIGDVKVFADTDCPKGIAFGLKLDTWKLHSLGECPGFLEEEGSMRILRESNSDAYEFRMGYYAQVGCEAPGYNIRITLLWRI